MAVFNLTYEGADLILNLVFRNTGTMPANLYMGLATSVLDKNSTLGNISEVTDSGYSRQVVTFNPPTLYGGKRSISTASVERFGPWTNVGSDLLYAFLSTSQSGTNGKLIAIMELPTPKSPLPGDQLDIDIITLNLN